VAPPPPSPPASAPAPGPAGAEGVSEPLPSHGGGSGWVPPSEDLLPTPHPGPPPPRPAPAPAPEWAAGVSSANPRTEGPRPRGLEDETPATRGQPSEGLEPKRGPGPAHPRGHDGGAFVRVPAEKLDALLARSGELLVARRRVESRGEALAE